MLTAYIIAYFNNDDQKTFILKCQKQVISYAAILENNLGNPKTWQNWEAVKKNILFCYSPLQRGGKMAGHTRIGKRFNGMLLPAYGKATFPGGHAEKYESQVSAAIREFKEELNLDNMMITPDMLNPISIPSIEKYGGQYYALDLKKITKTPLELLNKTNQWITEFEMKLTNGGNASIELDKLANFSDLNYPELHRVCFLPIDNISSAFDEKNNDWPYIEKQLEIFTSWFCRKLNINNNNAETILRVKLKKYLEIDEPIDWHKTAAEAFIEQLIPRDSIASTTIQFFRQPKFVSVDGHCSPVCLPPMP